MSMIIDVLRWGGRAALVLLAWAAVMAAMPFVGPAGRTVAVVGRDAPAVIVEAGGYMIEMRKGIVLARSDQPGFAARLYASGAPLVLEGRIAAGCLPLTRAGA